MNKKQLENFTGKSFPRGMGFPYQSSRGKYFIINSVDEMELLIQEHNFIDCYCTMYSFETYTQTERNKDTAIIDCIVFDLDSEDLSIAYEDGKKLVAWARRHGANPRMNFSGSKGVHVFIDIVPVKLLNAQMTLRTFMKELNDQAQLQTVDPVVTQDLKRILRIPGTINSKSGLYCIPINIDMLPYISIEDIIAKAKNPPTYTPRRRPTFGDIRDYLIKIDNTIVADRKEYRNAISNSAMAGIISGRKKNETCNAITNLIEKGCVQGQYDTALCGLISHFRDKMSEDEVLIELNKFNKVCKGQITNGHILDKLRYHYDKSYSPCTFFQLICKECDTCNRFK